MDFSKLEKSMVDVIKEQQIKLGYRSEAVRIYYPLVSVNRLLGREGTAAEAKAELEAFCREVEEKYGAIEISESRERFCFLIPPAGSDYVHAHTDEKEFIVELINTVRNHGCTLEQVLQVFERYSAHVHVERVEDGEFDYLVYFEDGKPDDFRYCLSVEAGHVMYHRFTPEDYEDFK